MDRTPSITREPTPPPPPPPPTGFTVEGTGTGTSETFLCDLPVRPDLTFSIDFAAQSDGTVTGTYTISVPGTGIADKGGEITDGTTDGSTPQSLRGKLILPMMTRVNTVQKISEGLFGSFLELMANQ